MAPLRTGVVSITPTHRPPSSIARRTMPGTSETPAGGLFGKLKGKAKETLGSLTNNRDLATEGQLEQDKADAAREAQRRDAEAAQTESQAEVEGALQQNLVE